MIKDNNKKTHYVVLGGKGGGQAESVDWSDIQNKPEFATVATTGDYDDLTDKPTILTQWFGTQAEYDAIVTKDPNVIYNIEGSDNVQADWNQTDTTADDFIKNKPTIPAAPVQSNWNESDSTSLAYIQNKPLIPVVNGKYDIATKTQAELVDFYTNYTTIMDDYDLYYGDYPVAAVGTTQMQGITFVLVEYNPFALTSYAIGSTYHTLTAGAQLIAPDGTITPFGTTMKIADSDSLATVATSGDYNDLQNKPTIPAAQVNSDWNSNSGVSQILNKPIIPAAQVNSDWDATSGKAQILNKPNLAPVATSGSYTSLKNRPTVPDETETLTFTLQGGTTVTMDVYVKPDYAKTYFFVQDLSGNGSTYTIETMDGDTPSFDVYTSTDQQTWTLLGTLGSFTTLYTTVPANGKLYIKATTDRWGGDEMSYCNAPYAIGGNIMSLLYGDNFANVTAFTPDNTRIIKFGNWQSETNLCDASKLVLPATALAEECYYEMFAGCNSLATAPALPATTLVTSCYANMFGGCTSLTIAPALPATTLAQSCYAGMFQGCTSLTTAPELPATTLADSCYSYMFNGCTSLATALALPATTLADSCYSYMFEGCTSLTQAPELPATTLYQGCYQAMFQGCTSLNNMSVYATDISASDCTANWLNNVSATGYFANLGGASYTRDASGIPAGWIVIN